MTCKHCQKDGKLRPNCPERQCFKYRGWGHEAESCPSMVQQEKAKVESAEMEVDQVSSRYNSNSQTESNLTKRSREGAVRVS